MQMVLPSIINSFLIAFAKGRVIEDNVFLAHQLIKHYEKKGISLQDMLKIERLITLFIGVSGILY